MESLKPSYSELEEEVISLKKRNEELSKSLDTFKQKKDEEAIQFQRYKSLIEFTSDGLALYEYGRLVYLSDGYKKMLGYEKFELLDISIEEIFSYIHPEDRDRIVTFLTNAHKNHVEDIHYEFRARKKNGEYIYVEDLIHAEYDNDGKHFRSIIHTHDVTEKKHFEIDLRQKSENLRGIIEAIPDMVFRMSKDFVYLDYKGEQDSLYYKEDSIIGKKNRDIMPSDFSDLVELNVSAALESGEIVIFEYSLNHRESGIKEFEARVVPLSKEEVVAIVRDITEKKQTVRRLAESEANARAIMESTNNIIIMLDIDGVILDSNEAHAKRLGLTRKDLIGKSIYELLPKEIAEKRWGMHKEVLRSGKAVHGEDFRAGYWNRYSLYPVINSEGTVEKVAVFSEDITENKRLLDELIEANAKMKLAAEVAHIGIWELDTETKELYCDEGMYKIFGIDSTEGKLDYEKAYSMIHPEDIEGFKCEIESGTNLRDEISLEFRIINPKNEVRYIRTSAGISRDAEGKILKLIGVDFDITEQKLAELRISESEANMRAMMENSLESIWSVDRDCRLEYLNKRLYEDFLHGFGIELKKGMRIVDLIQGDDYERWTGWYNRAFNNEHFRFVTTIPSKEKVIHHEVSMNPIIINNKVVGASCYSKDITERFNSEQALKKSETELRELNETKDKFFGIIAHDLRSPFQVFLSITELLKDKLETLTIKELSEMMTELNDNANNLFNLLKNLLEWANMQRRITKFEPKRISLKDVIYNIISLAKPLSERKKIEIIDLSSYYEIYADEYMLNSIFQNLIMNSIKFTKEGGFIFIHTSVYEEGKVEICVEDTGIGIPEHILGNLFRLDCNYKRPGTNGEESSGLGLLLCKDFVEKHNGKIWIESKEGKGSKFYFTI